jgi:hypothetical protein
MSPLIIRNFEPKDEAELVAAAKKDGHSVFFPSTVYVKDEKIVGYYSVQVPVVLSWQDSVAMHAGDSLKVLGHIEGSLRNCRFICIPCDPDSPFMHFLPKQGYESYFKPVTLFTNTKGK